MPESSSLCEVLETRRPTSYHWLILGLLVFAHAACGVLLNPAGIVAIANRGEIVRAPYTGFLLSQPLLLAFWTAFAPQRFHQRLLWGLLLCALLALAAEAKGLLSGDQTMPGRIRIDPRGFFLSMDLIMFCAATPPLLLVRRLTRWRLARFDEEPAPSSYQSHQFGIKHLLALTAIAALVCSLYRSLADADPSLSVQPIAEVAKIVFQITCAFLPMALIPWLTLGHHRYTLAASLFVAIFVVWLSDVACYLLFRDPRSPDFAQIFMLVQFGGGLSVLVSTLVIRWCGFRMTRQAKA